MVKLGQSDKTILEQLIDYKCKQWWEDIFKGDERAINYILYGKHVTNNKLFKHGK